MAVNGYIFTMADTNTDTFTKLCNDLQGLLKTANNDFEDMVASPLINRWAKCKPFRYAAWNFASDAARAAARKEVNQGFDIESARIGTTSDLSGIVAKYNTIDEANGWEYLHPIGGSSSPNRMRDFDGYNHKAEPFIGGMTIPSRWAKQEGDFPVSFLVPQKSDTDLTHHDIPAITNAYIGIAFVASDGTISRMTSTDTIAKEGISVSFPVINLVAGTYDVYPFLSEKPLTISSGNLIACNTYTLPNVGKSTVVYSEERVQITLSAKAPFATAATLDITISVTNNGSSQVTLTDNVIFIRERDADWEDPQQSNEKRVEDTPADFSVPSGQTITQTCRVTGINATLGANCTIWVKLGQYTKDTDFNLMKPIDPVTE